DGEIILGKIDTIEGFFVAAGDCGSGITLSGGIGSIMAELVVDGKSKTDISKFKPDRFGKIKIYEEKFLSECASARSAKSKGHSSLQNSN
ncbi:MAG: FAD-binding oxidoreductase, partial [Rhodobacterales bacterium]|nr:FAD-binding oxidoreductase [Rhodobacterales bacterium]